MFFIPLFESQLNTKYLGRDFNYLRQTTSTNHNVKDSIQNKVNGYTCLSENQSEGVGRRKTKWYSTAYKSLTFSFLMKEKKSFNSRHLSLLVATSISEAFNLISNKTLEFKFPNDLMINGKKVGGILINRVEYKLTKFFIIGIGINVNDNIDDLKIYNSTSIAIEFDRSIQREPFLAFILNFFEKNYESLKNPIDDWMKGCCHINKAVTFNIGNCNYSGIFKSLNEDINAKIEINNKIKNVSTGVFDI